MNSLQLLHATPPEMFSIVAVGNMNPAIHHPRWYLSQALITAEEEQLATAGLNLVVSPMLAQFSFGTFSLQCLQQRWTLLTTEEAQFPRVIDISRRTMDILDHTPVGVVGINLDYCRSAGVPNVGSLLGERVRALNLGVEGEDATGAVSWMRRREATLAVATTTVVIGGSADNPSQVLVKNNIELRVRPEVQHFRFAALFEEHVPRAMRESAEQLERTLAAIRRAGA